jgi:adenylate cyclase
MTALAATAGAAALSWDILFTEPDETNPASDQQLVAGTNSALKEGMEVIYGAVSNETPGLESDRPVTRPFKDIEGDIARITGDVAMLAPLPALQERASFGFVDTPPGPDGVRRVAPLLVRAGKRVYPSLTLETMLRYWRVPASAVRVRLGDAIYVTTRDGEKRIPIDERGGYLVNYRFGVEGAQIFGYGKLIIGLNEFYVENKTATVVPDLKHRILLVGQIATALTDNGPTPFSPHTGLVMVHANVIDNLLREDYARRTPDAFPWLGGVALGIAGLVYYSSRKLREQAVFGLGLPPVYGMAATWAWIKFSLWLPVVWPLTGFVALQIFVVVRRLIAEQRAKEQIKGMFGTYVSPELVSRMVASGVSPQLGGVEEEITAYFSDIQAYSAFSEKLPPAQLVELLNEYLTACTDIVQEEGGTLDKYIGDAVVAMFGAPIALPDHAYRACLAAMRVQLRLDELRLKWDGEGDRWPEGVRKMRSRIGLNTGRVIIGNMGSRTRFNYTMTGDNVNLAARMESGAKSWGSYAMTTEATKLACEKHGGGRVVFRALGRLRVVGRTQAVPIYDVMGLRESLPAGALECAGVFEQGLASYYARDWDRALALFGDSAKIEPNIPGKAPGVKTNPSLVYIDIVELFKADPPPEKWDGVYEMKQK